MLPLTKTSEDGGSVTRYGNRVDLNRARPEPYEVKVRLPGEDIPESYFQCRYDVLRHPLGFPIGSERLVDDSEAIHAWVERDGVVLCVGRAHLIDASSDGSAADHAGPGASICPAFGPLQQINSQNRPSIQIRQMGTRPQGRRQGLASTVLAALETELHTALFG